MEPLTDEVISKLCTSFHQSAHLILVLRIFVLIWLERLICSDLKLFRSRSSFMPTNATFQKVGGAIKS